MGSVFVAGGGEWLIHQAALMPLVADKMSAMKACVCNHHEGKWRHSHSEYAVSQCICDFVKRSPMQPCGLFNQEASVMKLVPVVATANRMLRLHWKTFDIGKFKP